MRRIEKSFKDCYYCRHPSVLVMIAPSDTIWKYPMGLCKIHLFGGGAQHGMSEDGYQFLTHAEFEAVTHLHKS